MQSLHISICKAWHSKQKTPGDERKGLRVLCLRKEVDQMSNDLRSLGLNMFGDHTAPNSLWQLVEERT